MLAMPSVTPPASETPAYAPSGALTGSLYATVTSLSPVRLADRMYGRIPSATASDATPSSSFSLDRSVTGPEPAGAYDSSMPDGLSSGRGPVSVRLNSADG